MKRKISALAGLVLAMAAGGAEAAKMISPVSVKVTSGGEIRPFWTVDNIIDQSGLSKKYVAGVTEFEDFVASNPRHADSVNTRWTSERGVFSATLVFDFGSEVTLGKLAFWDHFSSDNSALRFSTPDLADFAVFHPIEGTASGPPVQVFDFRDVTTRYLTLHIEGCNQGASFAGCGIDEIAFAEGVAGAVPEPATWAMMILGFGAAGAVIRRRRGMALA